MVAAKENIKLAEAQTKTLQTLLDAANKDNSQLLRRCADLEAAVTKLKVLYTISGNHMCRISKCIIYLYTGSYRHMKKGKHTNSQTHDLE